MLVGSTLVFVACAVSLVVMRRRSFIHDDRNPNEPWDKRIPESAANHAQVTGVLAGFSITIVVLAVTLGLESSSWVLKDAVLRMFVVSFFGYVSAALLFSVLTQRSGFHQHFLFCNASLLYFLSVIISFAAILLLLDVVGGEYDTGAAGLAIAVGAYAAACIPFVDLLRFNRSVCVVLAFVAASLTGMYVGLGYHLPVLLHYDTILRVNLVFSAFAVGTAFMSSVISFHLWSRRERLAKFLLLVSLALCATSACFVVFTTARYVAPVAREERDQLRAEQPSPRSTVKCVGPHLLHGADRASADSLDTDSPQGGPQ